MPPGVVGEVIVTSAERVIQEAIALVTQTQKGVRYSALHQAILARCPDIPPNTIHGSLHKFRTHLPGDTSSTPAHGISSGMSGLLSEARRSAVVGTAAAVDTGDGDAPEEGVVRALLPLRWTRPLPFVSARSPRLVVRR